MVSGPSIKPMLRAFVAAMRWFMKCETIAFGHNWQKTFCARLPPGRVKLRFFQVLKDRISCDAAMLSVFDPWHKRFCS